MKTSMVNTIKRCLFVLLPLALSTACTDSALTTSTGLSANYRIGSFNLRNFGPSRIENPAVMISLVSILKRYDLVLLMEIRDASGQAPVELLASINAASEVPYAMILSERLGRGDYKEQYALLYRPNRVQILSHYTYDDGIEPYQDLFEREPMVAYIDMGGVRFNLIGLHADPEGVALELNRLIPVYNDTMAFTGDPDAILLGDFNADCSYLSAADMSFVNLRNDPEFVWLIDDDADTTSSATDCAFDRIVVTSDLLENQIREPEAGVFNFKSAYHLGDDLAFEISNHYPVELSFSLDSQ